MASYIIVKYAERNWPEGKAPPEAAAHPYSYTARECGVDTIKYSDPRDASYDLAKMTAFNPTVNYGIVEVIEEDG